MGWPVCHGFYHLSHASHLHNPAYPSSLDYEQHDVLDDLSACVYPSIKRFSVRRVKTLMDYESFNGHVFGLYRGCYVVYKT